MTNAVLGEIEFDMYQRWLDRSLGEHVPLLIFDAQGACQWGDLPEAAELGRTLAAGEPPAAGLSRLDPPAAPPGQTVLYQSLGSVNDAPLGWAAVSVAAFAADAAPPAIDTLAEAMEDLTAGVRNAYLQANDLLQMTEELAARYEELHLVYAMDKHLAKKETQKYGVFQSMLDSTAEHLQVDLAAYIQPGIDLCLHAENLSKPMDNIDLVLVEMRGDLFRFLYAARETIVLNDPQDPRRTYIFTDMAYKILACPIMANRQIEGMLVLVKHADRDDFTNSDRKLAEVLAHQLASLAKTYLLIDSMGEFNEQMSRALIEAVEAKDPYTRGHSERVHYIAMEIGRAMHLSPDEMEDLHWGALLHDVGKIGIPDAVLCKPSRLTKDEYTFIMVHPERSYEILRHIGLLKNALPVARHHQEKYDGTGYPHGLAGERIPLLARLLAVADTYDSITSSRAYRAGRTHEMAMQEIERVAGTQLDPRIVEIFKQMVAAEPEWLVRFRIRREPK